MNLKQESNKKGGYLFGTEQIEIERLQPHPIHSPVDRLARFIFAGNTSSYGTQKDHYYLDTQPKVHEERWFWRHVTTGRKGEIFVSRVSTEPL